MAEFEITDEPSGIIINMIHEGLKQKNDEHSKDHKIKLHFSPTDTDKCPRQLWYEFKDFPKEELSTTEMSTLAIGNMTHDFLEKILPKQLCTEYRIELEWNGVPLTGYVDSIVLTKDGLAVVDYKTIKDMGVKFIEEKPKDAHVMQVQLYLDVLKLKTGYILYWNKSDGTMIEHKIEYDSTIIRRVAKFFKDVQEALEKNKLPEAKYLPLEDWRCRYCKYSKFCQEGIDNFKITDILQGDSK